MLFYIDISPMGKGGKRPTVHVVHQLSVLKHQLKYSMITELTVMQLVTQLLGEDLFANSGKKQFTLSLIHISEPTRPY